MARPRSACAHQKVLDAALDLFAERGIDATSMDAIAEVSGVSKATIYKHWADKEALCLEALVKAHLGGELPQLDSGDLRRDLIGFLEHRTAEEHAKRFRRLMPQFMAYASRNPEFGRMFKQRALERPRTRLREMLERGIRNGDLPAGFNVELGIALLLGPMMYRFAVHEMRVDLPADMPRQVVDCFLKAYGV